MAKQVEQKTDGDVRDPASTTPMQIIKPGVFDTDMRFYTVLIDADMAWDLLMYNIEPKPGKEGTNRNPSKVRIQEYADKMLAGRWHLSPQPIIFSEVDGAVTVSMQLDG